MVLHLYMFVRSIKQSFHKRLFVVFLSKQKKSRVFTVKEVCAFLSNACNIAERIIFSVPHSPESRISSFLLPKCKKVIDIVCRMKNNNNGLKGPAAWPVKKSVSGGSVTQKRCSLPDTALKFKVLNSVYYVPFRIHERYIPTVWWWRGFPIKIRVLYQSGQALGVGDLCRGTEHYGNRGADWSTLPDPHHSPMSPQQEKSTWRLRERGGLTHSLVPSSLVAVSQEADSWADTNSPVRHHLGVLTKLGTCFLYVTVLGVKWLIELLKELI